MVKMPLLNHSKDQANAVKANTNKIYHLGIGEVVSISTIIRANENRSYKIY